MKSGLARLADGRLGAPEIPTLESDYSSAESYRIIRVLELSLQSWQCGSFMTTAVFVARRK
jgi:hypothetical protein